MCVVEQKTYYQPDGSEKAFDRVQRCDKAINSGVLRCSNVGQTTGKARIVEVRPETNTSSSVQQAKNVTENNGHTRTYRDVVRRTGRKHETSPSKDLDDFETFDSPLQKSPSLEDLKPRRLRRMSRAMSAIPAPAKSAPAWMGPPHPLPPEPSSVNSSGTAFYELPPVLNIPQKSESKRRTNRSGSILSLSGPSEDDRRPKLSESVAPSHSTSSISVSPGLSRMPKLPHKHLDFTQDHNISPPKEDAEYVARRAARETARRQRALDEAILRLQEELEAAEDWKFEREAGLARYGRTFDALRTLPESLQPPRNSIDIEHASWSRHASTSPPRSRPVTTRNRFTSSAPLSSQNTYRHRNYGHATVHEYHFPDLPAVSRRPSDLIHDRGLEVIERERAKADTENHKSQELSFDEVKDAVNREESYYVSETPARIGIRRRRHEQQILRREDAKRKQSFDDGSTSQISVRYRPSFSSHEEASASQKSSPLSTTSPTSPRVPYRTPHVQDLDNRHPNSKEAGDQSHQSHTAPVLPQGSEALMMSTTRYPLSRDVLNPNESKVANLLDSLETQQQQELVTQQSQEPIEQPIVVVQERDDQLNQDLAPRQLSMLRLKRRGGSSTEPQPSDANDRSPLQQSSQAQLEHSHPIREKQAVSIEYTEEALHSCTTIASAAQASPDHSVVNAESDAFKVDPSTEQALAVSSDAWLGNTGPTHEQEVHVADVSQDLDNDTIVDNQNETTLSFPPDATVDAGSRQVIISEQYDDDNNSIYAESIFSQRSLASTMTSFSGHVNTNCTIEMIDRVISSLFSDDGLRNINAAATNDPAIGPERYRRNVRRMIKTFGLELRAEAGNAIEMRTAVAMQSRSVSTHVAREIMTRAGGTRSTLEPSNNDQQSDASVDSADEDEEASIEGLEDEGKLRSFILGSNACLHFKASLLDFVHKPYEARILSALMSTNFVTELHRDRIFLARIARELSWVPTNLLSISHDRSLGLSDHIKGFVEDTMTESWNWSPLEERRHRLQAGYYRLSWKSPDRRTQHIDLPEHVETAVQEAFDSAPAFITQAGSCNTNIVAANNTSTAGAANNSGPALPLPSYQAGGRISSTSTAAPQLPMPPHSSQSPTASLGLQPHGSGMQDPNLNHYLYLCVEGGSRQFIGIDCTSIRTDVSFFNRIKSEYDSARGWLRLYFSTWVYDHCEFFQFQKTGIGLGARLKIAFPEPTDRLYDYLPKPLEELQLPPHGPISRDEFHLHYYYQVCPSLMSWERWHRRITGLSRIEKEAFEAAPKRVIKLDMQNGKREHFYGLYAKEARSALRVAIHMSLCCLPGVIFFFLWLFRWGHGDDLQGASVPVQLSLTLVAGYLGVLFWTR